jgi:hypothetical protein
VSSGHYTRVKYDTLSEFIFVTLQNPIFCVKIVQIVVETDFALNFDTAAADLGMR